MEDKGQSQRHCLAVPIVVGLAVGVGPCLLFIVPDFGAQFAGVLFQGVARVGVQVERAGVVRGDTELVREVGLEKGRVATPQIQAAGDLHLVAPRVDLFSVYPSAWQPLLITSICKYFLPVIP